MVSHHSKKGRISVAVPPEKPKGWGKRHTLVLLSFTAFGLSYAMRFNLSLAIVAMVDSGSSSDYSYSNRNISRSKSNYSESLSNDETFTEWDTNSTNEFSIDYEKKFFHRAEVCPELSWGDENDNDNSKVAIGEFHWNEEEQGIILGSFFWGYVFTQLPGGILAAKYGGKWPLGLGLFITAIFTLFIPVAARTHKYLLIVCRVIQGLAEGVTTPAMHAILSDWAPPEERGSLTSISYAGSQFGTALTMLVTGAIINSNFLGGWPLVFYFWGVVTIIWFICWSFFMFSKPSDHPTISKEELQYIEESIGAERSKVEISTPWLKIFTSLPVWTIIIAHTGHTWGMYTLLTELPTYMKLVLNFDIAQNSWISAFPYVLFTIFSIVITKLADVVISRKLCRVVTLRKFCQLLAQLGSAVALIAASYTGCDRVFSVTLLTIAVCINGAVYGGYCVNHVDIAPNHAGVLMGITNTFANITGFLAPWVAGIIINENPSVLQWQKVFFIAAGIYIIEAIFYGIFASSTEQPWNRSEEKLKPIALEQPREIYRPIRNGTGITNYGYDGIEVQSINNRNSNFHNTSC